MRDAGKNSNPLDLRMCCGWCFAHSRGPTAKIGGVSWVFYSDGPPPYVGAYDRRSFPHMLRDVYLRGNGHSTYKKAFPASTIWQKSVQTRASLSGLSA